MLLRCDHSLQNLARISCPGPTSVRHTRSTARARWLFVRNTDPTDTQRSLRLPQTWFSPVSSLSMLGMRPQHSLLCLVSLWTCVCVCTASALCEMPALLTVCRVPGVPAAPALCAPWFACGHPEHNDAPRARTTT